MKYVLVLDVAKGKSMYMLSSNVGEVLLEPIEYPHNKSNFELIDSNITKLNIKDNLTDLPSSIFTTFEYPYGPDGLMSLFSFIGQTS